MRKARSDNAPTIGPAPTAGLNAGGQRARSNNITIDGADNNDNSVNSVRGTVSQEAVQEFQVVTNSYAPEFGRASGAVVNIVTKSGTNDFHGNLFGSCDTFVQVAQSPDLEDPATPAPSSRDDRRPIKKARSSSCAFEKTRRRNRILRIGREPHFQPHAPGRLAGESMC